MGRSKVGCLARVRAAVRHTPLAAIALVVLASPVTACDERTPALSSIEAVVVLLSECYLDRSVREDREYIAAILRTPAGHVGLVVAGERGHDRFRLRFAIAPGERTVALWHTHGRAGYARAWFSAADTRLANRLELASYLTTPEGVTRVYLPGEPTPIVRDQFRRVMPLGVAVGRVVRFQPIAGVARVEHSALRDRELGG